MLVFAVLIIIGLGTQAFRLKKQRDDKDFLALRYKELCIYAVENSANKHALLDYYSGHLEDEGTGYFNKKDMRLLNEALCNVLNEFKVELFDEEALNIHNYSAK